MSTIYIRIDLRDNRRQDTCKDREPSYKDAYRFYEGCDCFRCTLCRMNRA